MADREMKITAPPAESEVDLELEEIWGDHVMFADGPDDASWEDLACTAHQNRARLLALLDAERQAHEETRQRLQRVIEECEGESSARSHFMSESERLEAENTALRQARAEAERRYQEAARMVSDIRAALVDSIAETESAQQDAREEREAGDSELTALRERCAEMERLRDLVRWKIDQGIWSTDEEVEALTLGAARQEGRSDEG